MAQGIPSAEYGDYAGYYTFKAKAGDPFFNFEQFELHLQKKNGQPTGLESRVLFFTDTSLTRIDTECVTTFRRFVLSGDSLVFETRICFGEYYKFSGRFLGIPSQSGADGNNPVLEGTMLLLKNHRIVRQAAVKFFWIEGS